MIAIGLVVLLVVVFVSLKVISPRTPGVVRQSAVAGTWYPGTEAGLREAVKSYLKPADKLQDMRALIVPHAGYRFSAEVAGAGYSLVPGHFKKVVVVGVSHHFPFQGVSVHNASYYQTPLGLVPVAKEAAELLKMDGVSFKPLAHQKEHSIEIQLPFLQIVLPSFELIPILTSYTNPEWLAGIVNRILDRDTLVVVSSDLSHYKPYETARRIDNATIQGILALNISRMEAIGDACNKQGILTLMHLAKLNGWKPRLIEYKNSGDTSGDTSRGVVGYASIAFVGGELTQDEQASLLKLARQTLQSIYTKEKIEEIELSPALREKRGCFVTLNKNHQLRGCIGHILPQLPLYKCVMENTKNAALRDSRFRPVTQDELKDINIEISVLSVPQPLEYSSPDELLNKLRPMVDGVVLKTGMTGATYLPQVWEQLPQKQAFLSHLCLKARAPADCWMKGARISTYQALVFHE